MGFWRRGNYDLNTIDMIMRHLVVAKEYKIGVWYVGITANPIQSLAAHGIDIYARNTFECWDFPHENIAECKAAVMELEGCNIITETESDYINYKYPNMFIYTYQITDKTIQKIDVSGFTPYKTIPKPPVIVKYYSIDGKETMVRYDDSFDEKNCDWLLDEIKEKVLENQLKGLVIKPRGTHFMEMQFGEDGCIISYDSNTSQCGAFKSYRNGSKSRKLVKLFTGEYPEYMICRDVDVLIEILGYFIKKNNKPGKRQNVKWVVMPEEKDVRIFCKSGREFD